MDAFRRFAVASAILIIALPCACGSWPGWSSRSLTQSAASPRGLESLDAPRQGRALRASSTDPNRGGNLDGRVLPAGGTITLADLQGPGRITHVWLNVHADTPNYPRLLTLRAYWDGAAEPAIEAPLGDFFAVGHGWQRTVNSLPVVVASGGLSFHCYWPMPFRAGARLTLTNDSGQAVPALSYQIDWEQLDSLPAATPYFHAQYCMESPLASPGGEYVVLDTDGGRGHYVGTVLSVRALEPGWFGEGDSRFYIDGAAEPALQGTGIDNDFGLAGGLNPGQFPYFGVTDAEGPNAGARATIYRWHIADPIAFERSLKVTIEGMGRKLDAATGQVSQTYAPRADDFASVAFWYQTGTARRFATMPGASLRLPQALTIEAESAFPAAEKLPAEVSIQEGAHLSGGKQVYFRNSGERGALKVPLAIEPAGAYVITLKLGTSWDYGIVDIAVDDRVLARGVDAYSAENGTRTVTLGAVELSAGKHELRLEGKGANPASQTGTREAGTAIGLDAILLEKR